MSDRTEYRVILPVSFEACFYISATSPEVAAAIAVDRFEQANGSTRVAWLGAESLVVQDSDGGVIGTPLVEEDE